MGPEVCSNVTKPLVAGCKARTGSHKRPLNIEVRRELHGKRHVQNKKRQLKFYAPDKYNYLHIFAYYTSIQIKCCHQLMKQYINNYY